MQAFFCVVSSTYCYLFQYDAILSPYSMGFSGKLKKTIQFISNKMRKIGLINEFPFLFIINFLEALLLH
jgi:hypothetical protein